MALVAYKNYFNMFSKVVNNCSYTSFVDLSYDILLLIMQYLNKKDITTFMSINKKTMSTSKDTIIYMMSDKFYDIYEDDNRNYFRIIHNTYNKSKLKRQLNYKYDCLINLINKNKTTVIYIKVLFDIDDIRLLNYIESNIFLINNKFFIKFCQIYRQNIFITNLKYPNYYIYDANYFLFHDYNRRQNLLYNN